LKTRPVHAATGIGIVTGLGLGAASVGILPVSQTTQSFLQAWAWAIVVTTTLLPLISYLTEDLKLKGSVGGFVSGLGTGLGTFLLLASFLVSRL